MMGTDNSFFEKTMNSYGTIKTNRSLLQTRNKKVYPTFKPLIQRVINFKAFAGVKHKKIVLNDFSSSKNNDEADRFSLLIPYADQMLNWKILFDQSNPELGPDFEFDDKTFLTDPDLEELENNVPSLVNWDPRDPDSLIKVIMEFIVYYRKHQVEKLKNYERLSREYEMLLQNTEVCEEDVEVILVPDTIDPHEARFFIRIALDFSRLPRRSGNETDRDAITLQVTFSQLHWTRVVPLLYLSTSLEDVLGNSNTLHLPPFQPAKNLMKYVQEIKKLITDKMNAVIENFEKKRDFVTTALVLQGASIMEYDALDFSFITLLLNHNDFHFFLHISLTNKFPSEPPRYTLQSCYQTNLGNELPKQLVYNIPYSPRWESIRMITEAFNYILENEVEKFKRSSRNRRW
ncbi:BRISC and BRCA1-A complex member 2-like isoform X1 [Microplitis mediator]|uniref:BRISC and BRCA1-A complex member 2-like isoform X1 n=1 Tax=Microplitis mediator TaxID=375433 RepID=UPI0025560CD7|nr:BRISC and BRCA1-A complex member 2-like isoform X1 [Microplitis mediator]